MKKLILFTLAIMTIFMLTGCEEKKELSTSEFKSKVTEEGFLINDYTSMKADESIKTLLIAKNGKYEIEFHEYVSEDTAEKAFEKYQTEFKNQKKSKNIENSVSLNNYEKYALELSDHYNVVIRNGKTLLYVSINLQYKKDVNRLIKNIGY